MVVNTFSQIYSLFLYNIPIAFIYIILYNICMLKKDFLIFEELNNFSSEVDLVKSITKHAPRVIANEFLQFINQLLENLPEKFYANYCATLCSTNNQAYVKIFKERFNSCVWQKRDFLGRSSRLPCSVHIYYYIDNKKLVILVYSKDFNLKQQALPYAAKA